MGKNNEEKEADYRRLIIDEFIIENYKSKIWGSAQERYREKQKITRKIKKPNITS